jgi:hypothetical protein
MTCAKCGDGIILPIKLGEGASIEMQTGASFVIDCGRCGTTNTFTAEEPTSLEVVTEGFRTILRSRRWIADLVELRDTLSQVQDGVLSPEQAQSRLEHSAPAAATVVRQTGLDVAKLAAVLAVVVALLAWLFPDPLGVQDGPSLTPPEPTIDTDQLVEVIREAFDKGVAAERDRQAPRDPAAPPPQPEDHS